jgi:hypothetical protein
MAHAYRKQLNEIEKELTALGWRFRKTKSGVWAYAPDGKGQVSWHVGQGDPRSVKNLIAAIRRIDPRFRPR